MVVSIHHHTSYPGITQHSFEYLLGLRVTFDQRIAAEFKIRGCPIPELYYRPRNIRMGCSYNPALHSNLLKCRRRNIADSPICHFKVCAIVLGEVYVFQQLQCRAHSLQTVCCFGSGAIDSGTIVPKPLNQFVYLHESPFDGVCLLTVVLVNFLMHVCRVRDFQFFILPRHSVRHFALVVDRPRTFCGLVHRSQLLFHPG